MHAAKVRLKMQTARIPLLHRTVSGTILTQLRDLIRQAASDLTCNAIVLTEASVSLFEDLPPPFNAPFGVVVSPRFSVLLVTEGESDECDPSHNGTRATSAYRIGLSFDPDAIAHFLQQLGDRLAAEPGHDVGATLERAIAILQPNDATVQSQFTLSLIDLLARDDPDDPPNSDYPSTSVCHPVEQVLLQQVERQQLVERVTKQIRQSLELSEILSTAVEQMRQLLDTDRLAIYQFDRLKNATSHRIGDACPAILSPLLGRITYESRASDDIRSILNIREGDRYFADLPELRDRYFQGTIRAIEDVEVSYSLYPEFLEFFRQTGVRAQLVLPIVVRERLWGLLIAHQCDAPRPWQEGERAFLSEIAEHLAIAIAGAELYAELQRQKQTLEQRVTERTQALREALLAAQSANRAKSEFLATMSHELRTPLTYTIGMSATLLRWSFGQLSAKQRDYLQKIHDSGNHLLELINDILDLSQLESGKAVLNVSEFSLTKLTLEALQLHLNRAATADIELEDDVRVDYHHDRFRADRPRIAQIIYNLLSNAIKFTPPGGQVILRVWVERGNAMFEVEDTGIGIEPDRQTLLFEKFQQLDTPYTRQYGGTGLGLALTKQLVELHGGSIEVESAVGNGSKFTVCIPSQPISIDRATIRPASNLPADRDNLSTMSPPRNLVLIADRDDEATLICDILTAAGYQVVWMLEGTTAVEQVALLKPQAVLVDRRLNGMDGSEVIASLRQARATASIKILAIADPETLDKPEYGSMSGANDIVEKPIRPDLLLNKITELTTVSR